MGDVTLGDPSPALSIVLDSGAPAGSKDYTTVALIHGLMWQGTVFQKLLPIAHQHNARIVSFNRRGYPGTAPYTSSEHARLIHLASAPPSEVAADVRNLTLEHARELYTALSDFVAREGIPRAQHANEGDAEKGGLIVVGWSYGCRPLISFLAHAPALAQHESVDLSAYIRRAVFYDSSFRALGYPPPPNAAHPLHDISGAAPTATPAARVAHFHAWVTGYYAHTPGPAGLRFSGAEADTRLSAEERAEHVYDAPGLEPDGSDALMARACERAEVYAEMREAVMFGEQRAVRGASGGEEGKGASGAGSGRGIGWASVEMRVVWCERSIWPAVWCARCFADEVEEAQKGGRAMRRADVVQVRDANHFAHWDYPDRILRAFLQDGNEDVA